MINMVNPLFASWFCPQCTLATGTLYTAPFYEQLTHLASLETLRVIAASFVLCRPVPFADVSASHLNELALWSVAVYLRDN